MTEIIRYLIMFYMFTGFIAALDICYNDEKHGKQHGLFDTGFIVLLCILFWLPVGIISVYWFGLTALYNMITEEEND